MKVADSPVGQRDRGGRDVLVRAPSAAVEAEAERPAFHRERELIVQGEGHRSSVEREMQAVVVVVRRRIRRKWSRSGAPDTDPRTLQVRVSFPVTPAINQEQLRDDGQRVGIAHLIGLVAGVLAGDFQLDGIAFFQPVLADALDDKGELFGAGNFAAVGVSFARVIDPRWYKLEGTLVR